MTLRQRLHIWLLLVGIVVGAIGFFRLPIFRYRDPHQPIYRKGGFSEAMALGAFDSYSPWLIAGGVVTIAVAWMIRED
jgi:hypothetical protein